MVSSFAAAHQIPVTLVVSVARTDPKKRWRAGVRQWLWVRSETQFQVVRSANVNESGFVEAVPQGAVGLIRYFDQILRPSLIKRFS
ncbi:MAG: hypothetical protein AAFQ82_03995, partial [Myxococcota bacterium]